MCKNCKSSIETNRINNGKEATKYPGYHEVSCKTKPHKESQEFGTLLSPNDILGVKIFS